MNRRAYLSGAAAAGVFGLSGCLNTVLQTVTSVESTPAAVSRSALESTGYEAVGIEQLVIEEDVTFAGQSDTIVVTNHLSTYQKQFGIDGIAEQATATMSVLSTPKLEIAGRTLNPLGEMSGREVADLVASNYDGVDSIEHDADETIRVLGQSVTKSRFIADASLAGVPLELDLHVTEPVERGDDLLVAVGGYPRSFRTVEAANIRELSEAISPDPTSESTFGNANRSDEGNGGETTENESEGFIGIA